MYGVTFTLESRKTFLIESVGKCLLPEKSLHWQKKEFCHSLTEELFFSLCRQKVANLRCLPEMIWLLSIMIEKSDTNFFKEFLSDKWQRWTKRRERTNQVKQNFKKILEKKMNQRKIFSSWIEMNYNFPTCHAWVSNHFNTL